MTDPTPQADQEWFCVSCNHAHVMHQNVANGQSCHCGGCTAWVPKLRLAEPSPAPPAERVIEVAPQGEIPTAFDQSRGWEAIIKWAYANNDDGVLAVRDIAREFVDWRTRAQTAESALTAARKEIDRLKEVVK